MMCLRLLTVMLITISPSVSHARQVKETRIVSAGDHVREPKEAVRDEYSYSSEKEFQVPSATKAEVSEDKNTSEKSTKTGEMLFNMRKVSKNDDVAMINRAITASSKIESSNELKKDVSKHNNFVAFSADYHPPKGHPGRNN